LTYAIRFAIIQTMPLFEQKPIVVEAVQFNGKNRDEIENFVRRDDYHVSSYMDTLFLHESVPFGDSKSTKSSAINESDWIIKNDNRFVVSSNARFLKNYKEQE